MLMNGYFRIKKVKLKKKNPNKKFLILTIDETFSFKYEGVFDDIDSGNGKYNVKQAFEIKFERPIDYRKLKECMSNYLEKSGKFYQPKN